MSALAASRHAAWPRRTAVGYPPLRFCSGVSLHTLTRLAYARASRQILGFPGGMAGRSPGAAEHGGRSAGFVGESR